ncbi:sensor histidine kinase [Gracilibacillus phocaeensis]|uniref:sensor histidine kinase n=1 Tax=Gracilibacillus phocaeensis TaxID=2042304 RepID=UPI0010307767|nr:HAMP domain-containing sensor histidine kinase [Gracilibacillus phocaeensis]
MKKLRGRLFVNFSIQFGFISLLMICVVTLTFFIGLLYIANVDREADYYQAKLDELAIELYEPAEYENSGRSITEILPEGTWLQVINQEGEVVESENTPPGWQERYSSMDILQIKEREQIGGYTLKYTMEYTVPLENEPAEPYLYVLGYKEQAALLMNELTENNNHQGMIDEADQPEIEAKLNELEASLEIYDEEGDRLQQFGEREETQSQPLEVMEKDVSPDNYAVKQYTFLDRPSGHAWILSAPNQEKMEMPLTTYRDIVIGIVVIAGIILLITLLISFWNSFRYGKPLFIFTNWLNRMGSGNYEEVLTDREKKQVYRKNGKVKRRYKLYKEVFAAFYDMAEQLDASRKEREQLEKSREEWVAGISHDLRTPLTTMEGYGRMLENEDYDWSKQELQAIGKTISEKSDYMVDLMEDFMLSFQLKNDAMNIPFYQVNLPAYLEQILAKFQTDISFRDYPITVDSTRPDLEIAINKRLLERMIDNLIYNAWKHNPSGTAIHMEVKEAVNEKGLKITIEDNGVGIDEDMQQHLFSRYYRGTNTDEKKEGSGLGMNIALQIAKVHHGDITVTSQKDKGTTVAVYLPYVSNSALKS